MSTHGWRVSCAEARRGHREGSPASPRTSSDEQARRIWINAGSWLPCAIRALSGCEYCLTVRAVCGGTGASIRLTERDSRLIPGREVGARAR
jgi:hypothetical protein